MEERILMVQDESTICVLIAQRLQREGCSCVTVRNGKESLYYFYRDRFSRTISGLAMPEMNGIELLKQLEQMNPHTLVVIVSAYPRGAAPRETTRLEGTGLSLDPMDSALMIFSAEKGFEERRLEEEVQTYHQYLERWEDQTIWPQPALVILKRTHLDSVKVLSGVIEAKDPYTRGHSDRVRSLSLRIAMKLGLKDKRLADLAFGALLHDIGKIGIRDEVLQKKGRLSPEEYRHVQEHPLIGVKIMKTFDLLKDKVFMIRHHHEHFDGGGYPDRLVGDEIPMEARIITISDAFDAMTSLRPHRGRMTIERALKEMKEAVGKQFDPGILEIFLEEELYHSPQSSCPRDYLFIRQGRGWQR